MVILMVGESKIGAKLREKFEKENHRVLMAADAEEVGKLLQREEQIDLFVAALSFIDGLSEEEAEGLSAGMKSGVSAEADTDTGAVLGVKDDADISAGPDWEKAERLYDTCVIEPLSALQKAYSCLERGSHQVSAGSTLANVSLPGVLFAERKQACLRIWLEENGERSVAG